MRKGDVIGRRIEGRHSRPSLPLKSQINVSNNLTSSSVVIEPVLRIYATYLSASI